MFSRRVFQASTQPSTSYHFDAAGTLAVAATNDGIYVGRLGEPLVKSPDLQPMFDATFEDPHPNPAGDRLYILWVDDTLAIAAPRVGIAIYERTADTWRFRSNLPAAIATLGRLSTVFRGPTGDRLIFTGAFTLAEYEEDAGTWMLRGEARSREELRIDAGATMAITSDGLRAVFRGDDNQQMLYADRPNLDGWFQMPRPLTGVPKVLDPQITDDCARVYYSGLNTAFYSQQQ